MNPHPHLRPLIFGEVLFDRFPDGSQVLGGAPFNVAWHLQAWGADPLLISRVGNDALGGQIRATMEEWDMDTAGLQQDPRHPTGTVEVSLSGGEPNFDIVTDCAYDFLDPAALPSPGASPLLYHGTLALRSLQNLAALAQLGRSSGAPVLLDVNLRPPWWQRAAVQELLAEARWVKLNEAELATLAPAGRDPEEQACALQETGQMELLIVTLGAAGALARQRYGTLLRVAPPAAVPVVDTVGAGDAFAAVVLLGLLRGWALATTLERAQSFAAAVVGIRGATPQRADFYIPFLERWGLPVHKRD
jgi:fructokinase